MVAMWDKWQGITRNWTFGRLLGFLGTSQIYGVFFTAELAYAAATEQIGIWSTKYRWGYGLIGRVLLRSQSLIWDPVCTTWWYSPRDLDQVYCPSSLSLCPCLCMDIIQTSGSNGCSDPRILDSLDRCIRTAKAWMMDGMMGGSRSLGMWVTLISIGGLAA